MYSHLLVPSDGSELAERGVTAAIEFARSIGARVTAFTAMPEYRLPLQSEIMAHKRIGSPHDYEQRAKRLADEILGGIAQRAAAAGVDCSTDYSLCDRPHEAIIAAAGKHHCDLIFMASHGRGGLSALIHGSETSGVLARSTIPTLVYR